MEQTALRQELMQSYIENRKVIKTADKKEIGYIGLGRMGSSIVKNLLDNDIRVAAYDKTRECADRLLEERKEDVKEKRLECARSLEELAESLEKPKAIWLMIKANAVDKVILDLLPYLSPGDTLIDGGNSYFKDSIRRAGRLREKGVYFLDVGTSGGVKGAREGACLMIGGEREAYETLESTFRKIAAPNGYEHVGKSGCGHFVKMVHNLIEYGMEKCIGEGMELLKAGKKIFSSELELRPICDLWNHGSIIQSKLIGYLAEALGREELGRNLEQIDGVVGGGETGEWGVKTAMELGVPVSANAAALFARYASRLKESLENKSVAAMRNMFGEHEVYYKNKGSEG